MSAQAAFLAGLSNVFSWPGILIPVMGTLMAMVASFLPGIGNASVAVLAMVMTLNWDRESVLLLFGALTGGATFMGSITAILFNVPGSVSSTPALLEGYPLARLGLPRMAIACAATASALGSVFGVVLLLVMLPVVEPWILKVGPLETLLIGVMGLLTIVAVPSRSHLKSACMVGLGLLLAMVGTDPLHGLPRWSMGSIELAQGIGIVPLMMGVFTVAELIEWLKPRIQAPVALESGAVHDSTRAGVFAVFRHWRLALRSSLIGTLIGMVPGIGGTVAGFVAYGHAVQSSGDDRQQFGRGDIRGLIAPEAAVDAKDGGSLLPTLALGLPGSEACVILLAVFAIHGLEPGTSMLTTHLALTYTLVLALLLSNLLTSVVGVMLTPWLAKAGSLRIDRIALPCLLLCVFSAVQLEGSLVDLYVTLGFGIVGYYWRLHGWPRIPFVIAFVLGKIIEKNLAITLQLTALGRIDMTKSAIAIALLFGVLVSMGWLWITRSRRVQEDGPGVASLGLALVAGSLSLVMLLSAISRPEAYSRYAQGVALATTLSYAWVVLLAMRRDRREGFGPAMLTDLCCEAGHGASLLTIALLMPGSWLLGLGPAVGLAVTAWLWGRSTGGWRRWCWASLAGLLSAWLIEWILDLLNVWLEPGWLSSLFLPRGES
jgi:putative tricarboxylic transport membrane protein